MIDIIIFACRGADYLTDALDSVQRQRYPHWTCWIVEDGRSSETLAAIRPFLEDKRYCHLPGPLAGTPTAPLNRAMTTGSQPFIAFLDDDAMWLSEKLERQIAFFEAHPEAVLLGCNAYIGSDGPHPPPAAAPARCFQKTRYRRISYRKLAKKSHLINSTLMMRRSALPYAGLQNETHIGAADEGKHEFWLRVAVFGETWLAETPLVICRSRPFKKMRPYPPGEDRNAAYRMKVDLYEAALKGAGEMPSPLSFPEYERQAAACRWERDFYTRGPRHLGRLRHAIASAVRQVVPTLKPSPPDEDTAVGTLAECKARWSPNQDTGTCLGIVFSKDRALQLHALLTSYLEKVTPILPLSVLFHASTDAHRRAYMDVIRIFRARCDRIRFVDQDGGGIGSSGIRQMGSFKTALLEILLASPAAKVCFLVDDIVFTEPVDMTGLLKLDTERFVPSLRLGKNLTRCYTLDKEQPLPPFEDPGIAETDMICWKWEAGVLDWAYPLSVDGHLFDRREVAAMAALTPFCAPNTFEARLQRFLPHFRSRMGAAYVKSRIINIPVNRVQNEFDNRHGTFHQEDLLEKWQDGYQVDYEKIYGFKNESAHQEVPLAFKRRN